MSLSFTFLEKGPSPKIRKVLVTGAAGNIGSYFARRMCRDYDLRLMVHEADERSKKLSRFGRIMKAELGDLSSLRRACAGVDAIVHLAGEPGPEAVWEGLLGANIVGAYNLFAAARAARCSKVVFASSIHAVSGYPADLQVKTSDPVNPGDLYGVTKCFGEALGRYLAEQEKMRVYVLRIGAFQSVATARRRDALPYMESFVSRRDLAELIRCCLNDKKLRFGIFHGLSDNRFKRLDLTDTRELLDFSPRDDFTRENPRLKPLKLGARVRPHNRSAGKQKSGLRKEVEGRR